MGNSDINKRPTTIIILLVSHQVTYYPWSQHSNRLTVPPSHLQSPPSPAPIPTGYDYQFSPSFYIYKSLHPPSSTLPTSFSIVSSLFQQSCHLRAWFSTAKLQWQYELKPKTSFHCSHNKLCAKAEARDIVQKTEGVERGWEIKERSKERWNRENADWRPQERYREH